jgi:hypothetical protein
MIEVAVLGLAPGRAHAEAARARRLRGARLGEHGIEVHQLFRPDAGRVAGGLRAIGAVLRAAAGLDREQRRNLHLGRIEVEAVNALRAEDQFRERQREQFAHVGLRPVVADRFRRHRRR